MAREKIQIKKIGSGSARQVAFLKRRRGLFKKAKELSVLCDADVAVVIFSSNDKLFEYGSSSVKEIVERYSKNFDKLEQPSHGPQLVEDMNCFRLSQEVAERGRQLRRMRGEELHGLSIEELHNLEMAVEAGLRSVMEKKGEKIMNEIDRLQEKGKQLRRENERLRQRVAADTSNEEELTYDPGEVVLFEQGQSSESVNAYHSSGPPNDYDSSETSLRL